MIKDDFGLAGRINAERSSCLDDQHEELFRKKLKEEGITLDNIDDLNELIEYIQDGTRAEVLRGLLLQPRVL